MTGIRDTATILRNAGLAVVVEDTWDLTPKGLLAIDPPFLVWHHDGSPEGPSPGSRSWITTEYRAGRPSAQLWVDYAGVWHLVGRGRASHAGEVLPGMPGNSTSAGIETDHTIGEPWPADQLASLRAGTAALLSAWNLSPALGLWFHKQIASPPGRKPDPDGLEIHAERAAVALLMATPPAPAYPTPTTDPDPEDEMPYTQADRDRDNATAARVKFLHDQLADVPDGGTGQRSIRREIAAILARVQLITRGSK